MFPPKCKIDQKTNFSVPKAAPGKLIRYFWTGGNINAKYESEEIPKVEPKKVIRLSTMIRNLVDPRIESEPYYGEDIKGSHNQVNAILRDKMESLSQKNDEINKYLAEIERLKNEAANKNNNNSEGLTPPPTPEPQGEQD